MKLDAPVFLHATLFRSGSNYLARLLELHPDLVLSSLPEDWLLAESDHLVHYSKALEKRWAWDSEWNIGPETGEDLLRHLGDGLISFLRAESGETGDRRLVCKTPDVQALPNFFCLFPGAPLLILVRDGRSVVESSERSFGYSPHQVARWWARAAERIIDFERANRGSERPYRIVRYEDLHQDPAREILQILRFLELDPQAYDFTRIDSLPVFGSSDTRNASGEWEWAVTPGSGSSESLQRWSNWSRGQHERFNGIAGEQFERSATRPGDSPGTGCSGSFRRPGGLPGTG